MSVGEEPAANAEPQQAPVSTAAQLFSLFASRRP
jgi:hypothetical protein